MKLLLTTFEGMNKVWRDKRYTADLQVWVDAEKMVELIGGAALLTPSGKTTRIHGSIELRAVNRKTEEVVK